MATDRNRPAKTDARTSTFAINLRTALEERHLQQADLARATGYSRDAINRYANGITLPPLSKIAGIASALGVEPGVLDPEFPENPKFWKNETVGPGYSIQSTSRPGIVRFVADIELSDAAVPELLALLKKAKSEH